MNRIPDVIVYVKNLIQSIQPWIVRGEFQAMKLSIVTVEGEELVSLIARYSLNTLCQDGAIDYSRLENSLKNSLLSVTSSIPNANLPENSTLSVDVDVLENANARITSEWNLCVSSLSQPLFIKNHDKAEVKPLSTVFAGTQCVELLLVRFR